MIFMMLAAVAAATVQRADMATVEFDPRRMTQSAIREHNTGLDRKDPNYIRCVREDETGSLVKKSVSCRTNAQWDASFKDGNQNAHDTYEAMRAKTMNGN
ncbi:hypothetical protein [Novosphingobium sp. FKTRR1]|uniref:hypothetical protein n=1 Tax=Novosphingobium sp. FKTRR1 TaxID=2879118 RepID=UPI001CF07F92|nr:hypothetical protein [Novosphingobium sp. FKTRR1]